MTVDAFLSKRANPGDYHHSEWIEFMRELERDRDEARKIAGFLRAEMHDLCVTVKGFTPTALFPWDKKWCAACGKHSDHTSGTCPTIKH